MLDNFKCPQVSFCREIKEIELLLTFVLIV